ncbi:hypothetical protein EB118_03530 [bacterium]|nr:hypothetical protein [bacterium]
MNETGLLLSPEYSCCVCFENRYLLCNKNGPIPLGDIDPKLFHNGILPEELLFPSACGVHYLCVGCTRRLLTDYTNHPINETNSHFACPFPFSDCVTSIGFKIVFDHSSLEHVFLTQRDYETFLIHANAHAFPGYTLVRCPLRVWDASFQNKQCDSVVFVENESIRNSQAGDLVIQCHQNSKCLRKFCYNCNESISYYQLICFDCKTNYEMESENVHNYFFNKNAHNDEISYTESDYLYLNREITKDIAVEQIKALIEDVTSFLICPVCKIGLYKTERCNGLTHHNIERCYACGRIGYKVKGLVDHWNGHGHAGCFRFDHDNFVSTSIPDYKCSDTLCHSHDRGDCPFPEHQKGIADYLNVLKRSYIFSMIKSLLPTIRYDVYDTLFLEGHGALLPYKQTLLMVQEFKKHVKDYTEEIVYKRLNCIHPSKLGYDKMYTIEPSRYIVLHKLESIAENTYSISITEPNTDTEDGGSDSTPLLMENYLQLTRVGSQEIVQDHDSEDSEETL